MVDRAVIDLADLDYALPASAIAQRPAQPRDAAKLLVLDRASGALAEHRFGELADLVGPDDLLVVNDSRVIPARIRGEKPTGGRVEALLLEPVDASRWRALLRMPGRLREGQALLFGGDRQWSARIESVASGGEVCLCFESARAADTDAATVPDEIGEVPLPPYIERERPREEDREDYQTVFARVPGSVASPTASRHFTPELAGKLRIAEITLHVGPGTFQPIRGARVEDHVVGDERFEVPLATARAIAETRRRRGRVIAVGTTVVRALESTRGEPGTGRTQLFIHPGYRFGIVDSLITCFHLPRSSLLALVMAFAGVESTRAAYGFALARDYRFYSYGDAMWIR